MFKWTNDLRIRGWFSVEPFLPKTGKKGFTIDYGDEYCPMKLRSLRSFLLSRVRVTSETERRLHNGFYCKDCTEINCITLT